MATTVLSPYNVNVLCQPRKSKSLWYLGLRSNASGENTSENFRGLQIKEQGRRLTILAATEGSSKSTQPEEKIPSWARPDSDELPPWAREGDRDAVPMQSIRIPFFVYLLASTVAAIVAVGSIFEYVNQRPVFGIVSSDSMFYTPLLGFFVLAGIPTSAFLWFKSVEVANQEAEEQDRRDGFR